MTWLDLTWLAAKLVAAIALLVVCCVLLVASVYVVAVLAKRYPWSALGAAPMIAAYAWAIWGNSPAQGWRILIAFGVQVLTLAIGQAIAR